MAQLLLKRGQITLVDDEDFEKIKQYSWYLATNGYVVHFDTKKRKTIGLHRFILGVIGKKIDVDHINHNLLNNRKINLRICNRTQNNMNMNTPNVYFEKQVKKWRARIGFYGKTIHIGMYKTKNEAIDAYRLASRKYFGKFAYKGGNSPSL